jgi:carbamoyl-phosphate synthase small subunit
MQRQKIPGICNIDTRMLTKKLRNQGMMLGKIVVDDTDLAWEDPNERNLVAEASLERPRFYPGSGKRRSSWSILGARTASCVICSVSGWMF